MHGEAVGELQRLALLEREGPCVDDGRIDHPLVGPQVEARARRGLELREGDAFAGRGIREVEEGRLAGRAVSRGRSAGVAAHRQRRGRVIGEAERHACVARAPFAGGDAAPGFGPVERHIRERGERVECRNRVAALRVRRIDDDATLLGKDGARAARPVLEAQVDGAVLSVDLHLLLHNARRAGGFTALPFGIGRLPVVDAIDELPGEPVAEVPHVIRGTRGGE